jgi:hypothetical protein
MILFHYPQDSFCIYNLITIKSSTPGTGEQCAQKMSSRHKKTEQDKFLQEKLYPERKQ